MGTSGWGVACPSRVLMSPPFLWNSCNVPRHHRCKRGGVPCEPPPERASKKIIASTTTRASMKSTSFFLAAEWMSAIGLKERMSGPTQESSFPSARSPTLHTPRLGHPTSRPAPSAAGGRTALRPRGSQPRRGRPGSSAQPPSTPARPPARDTRRPTQPRARVPRPARGNPIGAAASAASQGPAW